MAFFVCVYLLLGILSQFSVINGRSYFSPLRINRLNNLGFIRNYSIVPQKGFSGDNFVKLDPYFVIDLTEAEGSFFVVKRQYKRAKHGLIIELRFKITMLINELFKQVQYFFWVETLYVNNNTLSTYFAKVLRSFVIPFLFFAFLFSLLENRVRFIRGSPIFTKVNVEFDNQILCSSEQQHPDGSTTTVEQTDDGPSMTVKQPDGTSITVEPHPDHWG